MSSEVDMMVVLSLGVAMTCMVGLTIFWLFLPSLLGK